MEKREKLYRLENSSAHNFVSPSFERIFPGRRVEKRRNLIKAWWNIFSYDFHYFTVKGVLLVTSSFKDLLLVKYSLGKFQCLNVKLFS